MRNRRLPALLGVTASSDGQGYDDERFSTNSAGIAKLSFIARIAVARRRTHTGERSADYVFDKYLIRRTERLPQEVGQENAM